ncbi:glycoside hydrolase family 88 protein [Candidatus Bathyarchaeota archaeon]|nr:glycoside hydrolase family 88 protein [Candidatus Bathyarchaeota archaeon]
MKTISEDKEKNLIEKMKVALLGMQRYNWEQGVAAQAMLELGDDQWVVSLARAAIMRQQNGRFSVIGNHDPLTDSASVGEAVLCAAKITRDPLFTRAANEMLHLLLTTDHRAENGALYHVNVRKEIWVDAYYMAPPFLAAAGYYEEAIRQIEGYREFLWNDGDKLFSHIWDDEKKVFKRKDYWGVGNGWAAAGITRVIKALSDEMEQEKSRLVNYVKAVIDGCLAHIREDGFFHDVVDNPNTFVETNLGQMLSYSIYRGAEGGWLDSSYIKFAEKMRRAARSKVDRYGLVQDVCGVPDFNRPYIAPEGQAFFLLMEAAARDYELCKKNHK